MTSLVPGASLPDPRPPDANAGSRRPPQTTSSPNSKADREMQQAKKRAKAMKANPLFEAALDMEETVEMEGIHGQDDVDGTQNPVRTPLVSAWGQGNKLFSDVLQEDVWYVAESDSEDVNAAMHEDDLDDEIPEDDDPKCPTIPFKAMEKLRYRRKWRSTLIVKVLRKTFPFQAISRRLESLWAKCGTLQISSLSWGFYVVRFTSQMDYEQAAQGGPWTMGGHYITVRPWRKGFDPRTAEVATTMVWARLPGLPIEFINREAVEHIASRIGRAIKVDRATQNGDIGRFARVCVEVDLTKPLLSQYKIEVRTYYIEFEGLYRICTECGQYGHNSTGCPSLFQPTKEATTDKPVDEAPVKPTKLYGEWMVAKPRSQNRANKVTKQKSGGPAQAANSSPSRQVPGSRFDVLSTEEGLATEDNMELEITMRETAEVTSMGEGNTRLEHKPPVRSSYQL
ncbi:unnamed protein product [Linum trigynum]|uniref:CCHC-type domain-containing protein n=1 Tax=Linum trigynum TaxID=586398 RepID=A0AAV2F609_9ROSI